MCAVCRYDYGNVVALYPQFYCKEAGEGGDELSSVSSITAENYKPVKRVFVHQLLWIFSLGFNDQQYIHT